MMEEKGVRWEAREEDMFPELEMQGHGLGHRLVLSSPHPELLLTSIEPPVGVPGQGHVLSTGNPGLLATLKLDDHIRSGGGESCEEEPQVKTAHLSTESRSQGFMEIDSYQCNWENLKMAQGKGLIGIAHVSSEQQLCPEHQRKGTEPRHGRGHSWTGPQGVVDPTKLHVYRTGPLLHMAPARRFDPAHQSGGK